MKAAALFFLIAMAPASRATNPYAEEDWMREGLASQVSKFKRTTFTPHPEYHGVVAANCETDPAWWGQLRVFHHDAGRIDWIASEPASYLNNRPHYVLACEWRHLEKLQRWILEVFESTHMGNGDLWLFALEKHALRVLLHTTARGRFLEPPPDLVIPSLGETHLVEEHLRADYRVIEGTETEAVFLTGTIAALDQEGRRQSTKPYAETWTWDATQRAFTKARP